VAAQAADQPLASWEFNRDGDAEKWYPAHSLAPFEVAGGILKTHATAGDPYMIASEGDAFDLTANDFQYVEIRLKSDKDGYGEFFWASTVEGKDAGFVGGKERGFGVRGDGQFHIYRVFPIWQGRVTRLRFDPPDDANLEIDYIRVMQTPPSTHEATSPRWDFAKDGAGGFIPTSGCTYDAQAGGLKVTMDNENAILTSSVLDLSAADYACVTLHFTASAPMQIMLNWSDTTDGNFPGSNVIPVDLSAGEDYVTLHFSDVAAWAGAIKRIAIGVAAKPDDTLTLQSLAFAKQPEGPAKLTVISLSGERSIYATGDKARLVLKVRNDGGETARNVRATLNGADAISLPDLGPGLTAEASWTLAAAKPGLLPVSVKLEADNAFRAAQAATELIVTEPMPELTATGGKPFAAVRGAGAILGNDKLQLTFAGDPSGFRSARVDLRDGSRTRTMGFLPHLASLAVGDDAAPVSMTLKVVNSKSSATGASLSMKGTRGPVTVEVTYSVKPGQTWVDIAYRVTSSKGAVAMGGGGFFRRPAGSRDLPRRRVAGEGRAVVDVAGHLAADACPLGAPPELDNHPEHGDRAGWRDRRAHVGPAAKVGRQADPPGGGLRVAELRGDASQPPAGPLLAVDPRLREGQLAAGEEGLRPAAREGADAAGQPLRRATDRHYPRVDAMVRPVLREGRGGAVAACQTARLHRDDRHVHARVREGPVGGRDQGLDAGDGLGAGAGYRHRQSVLCGGAGAGRDARCGGMVGESAGRGCGQWRYHLRSAWPRQYGCGSARHRCGRRIRRCESAR
jgi:hypothetical protein